MLTSGAHEIFGRGSRNGREHPLDFHRLQGLMPSNEASPGTERASEAESLQEEPLPSYSAQYVKALVSASRRAGS